MKYRENPGYRSLSRYDKLLSERVDSLYASVDIAKEAGKLAENYLEDRYSSDEISEMRLAFSDSRIVRKILDVPIPMVDLLMNTKTISLKVGDLLKLPDNLLLRIQDHNKVSMRMVHIVRSCVNRDRILLRVSHMPDGRHRPDDQPINVVLSTHFTISKLADVDPLENLKGLEVEISDTPKALHSRLDCAREDSIMCNIIGYILSEGGEITWDREEKISSSAMTWNKKKKKTSGSVIVPGFIGPKDLFRRAHVPQEHSGDSRRMHWRLGHWRRQRCGEKNMDTKILWIKPTIINRENIA